MAKGKPVRSGQLLDGAISAEDWNALLDMIVEWKAEQHSLLAADKVATQALAYQTNDYEEALIYNDTGQDLDRGEIVGLEEAIIDPADNWGAWAERPVLTGVVPTTKHRARFGVLLEPIPRYGHGKARISGIAATKVVVDDEHPDAVLCDVDPDLGCTALKMGQGGSAMVLGYQDVGNTRYAWIRFGVFPPMETLTIVGDPNDWTVFSPATPPETRVGITVPLKQVLCFVSDQSEDDIRSVTLAEGGDEIYTLEGIGTCESEPGPHVYYNARNLWFCDWTEIGAVGASTVEFDLVDCLMDGATSTTVVYDVTADAVAGAGCEETTLNIKRVTFDRPTWIPAGSSYQEVTAICVPATPSASLSSMSTSSISSSSSSSQPLSSSSSSESSESVQPPCSDFCSWVGVSDGQGGFVWSKTQNCANPALCTCNEPGWTPYLGETANTDCFAIFSSSSAGPSSSSSSSAVTSSSSSSSSAGVPGSSSSSSIGGQSTSSSAVPSSSSSVGVPSSSSSVGVPSSSSSVGVPSSSSSAAVPSSSAG